MSHFLLPACFALAMAALAPACAATDVYAIESEHDRELGVIGGQARLVKGAARGRDWELQPGEGTTTIRAAWGDWDGWYLACGS